MIKQAELCVSLIDSVVMYLVVYLSYSRMRVSGSKFVKRPGRSDEVRTGGHAYRLKSDLLRFEAIKFRFSNHAITEVQQVMKIEVDSSNHAITEVHFCDQVCSAFVSVRFRCFSNSTVSLCFRCGCHLL